ncbi:hypothetical protein D3C85_1542500 [compost metagenome]
MQQFGQVVASQAHDHLFAWHQLQNCIQHSQLFLFAKRCGFAGGAANYYPVDTFFHQMADQLAQPDEVDRTVIKRRNDRNPDTLKR